MLGSIKNIQVIVHLPLLNVVIPANAMIFFSVVFEIISFDPLDVEDWIADIFEIENNLGPNYISPNFELLGYESAFFVINLGSQALIWFL